MTPPADRRAFDRIIPAGGHITAPMGTASEADSTPLFTAATVTHLGLLPQGRPERDDRVVDLSVPKAGFRRRAKFVA